MQTLLCFAGSTAQRMLLSPSKTIITKIEDVVLHNYSSHLGETILMNTIHTPLSYLINTW